MTQVSRKDEAELDAPFAQGFVTDLSTTLVQQFLNLPVAQGRPVVLRDGPRESVAVRLGVSHGESTYSNLIKATQPLRLVANTIGSEHTTYADMCHVETLVRGNGLDWTSVQPTGLFTGHTVTRYETA